MVVNAKAVKGTSLLFVLQIILSMLLYSCNNRTDDRSVGREMVYADFLEIDSSDFRLGKIKEMNGPVNCIVVLKNNGDDIVCISAIPIVCSCLSVKYDKKMIYPNDSLNFKIQFDPYNRKGYFTKKIIVLFNDGKYYTILTLSGFVE